MSQHPAEPTATAFRLRRLDRRTIAEVADLLCISPSQIRRLVSTHERMIGITWPQSSCGNSQIAEETEKTVIKLLEAGFLSREIAAILGYTWGYIRGIVAHIRRTRKIHLDRLSVQRCGSGVGVLLTRPPVQLAGWRPGQGIVWSMESGKIILFPHGCRQEEDGVAIEELWETSRVQASRPPSVFKEAYELYMHTDLPVRAIAGRLEIAASRVFGYAEQHAQQFRLPLEPRRPSTAKRGVSRVQSNGLLKIQSPVTRYGWPKGADVLWKLVRPGRISLEQFNLAAVRESLGI